ncbi:GFA family protein [Kaustia mangrovi]|uniref:GFA family protein n=1 Tax=Kaustia mangrovi TaxID=2593653 RepID=A0A7S8C6W4_9HYPH|nr:GFA family protein [Kaustia mangrovi]QPC44436.1 GFA family protein [Kaustia mangrovi]
MSDGQVKNGSCLCGAVRFTVREPLRPVVYCHCHQCRKQTGHYMAATSAPLGRFVIIEDRGLRWYRASEAARRGFCSLCGSTLFWHADGADRISIAAGAIDGETGIRGEGHIFCADKGDYYEIADGDYRWEEDGRPERAPMKPERSP